MVQGESDFSPFSAILSFASALPVWCLPRTVGVGFRAVWRIRWGPGRVAGRSSELGSESRLLLHRFLAEREYGLLRFWVALFWLLPRRRPSGGCAQYPSGGTSSFSPCCFPRSTT